MRGVSNSLVRCATRDEAGETNRPVASMGMHSGGGTASATEADCLRIQVMWGNARGTDLGGVHPKEEQTDR